MRTEIDWKVVNQHLKCPKCGEKAFITPESDGTEGMHSHVFRVTREHALELTIKHSKPTYKELEQRIEELECIIDGRTADG